jgi:site-specific DNA recombinase
MAESDKTPRRSTKKARCAIYTRKSSEEGLEQAFNSLDAQAPLFRRFSRFDYR